MRDLLHETSRRLPDHIALIHGSRDPAARASWTYRELQRDVDRLSAALLHRFRPGERVGIWAPNVAHWIPAQLALANAGLVMVTLNPAFQQTEVAYALHASGASGVLVAEHYGSRSLARIAEALMPELPNLREVISFDQLGELMAAAVVTHELPVVRPDDVVQLQFTSGTTGFPKGAMLTHRGVSNNAILMAERTGVTPATRFVRPSLLYHVGGSVASVLMNLAGGGTIIPMARWSPQLAVELIETYRATLIGGVPTMMRDLLETATASRADLSSLRTVVLGAAPIPAELVEELRARLGIDTVTMYGQTESGPTVTMTSKSDDPLDTAQTVGTLLAGTEARVVNRVTGADVADGQAGELLVRSPMLMKGYHEDAERTSEAIDTEGWLHTGDVCTVDERGYFTIRGRVGDMIIRGGANVYPREVEEALLTHPLVDSVAVLGVPHPRLGESVAAFIQAIAPVQEADLLLHVEGKLARYKLPTEWYVVDEFPLTATGKIQKHVLRERLEEATPLTVRTSSVTT